MRGFWRRRGSQHYGSVLGELEARDKDLLPGVYLLLLAMGAFVSLFVVFALVFLFNVTGSDRTDADVAAELTPAPSEHVIICDAGPIDLEEGTETVVRFNAAELDGYELTNVQLNPVSVDTPSNSLEATIEGALSTLLHANQTDEVEDAATFQLRATFNKGDGETISICTVRVLPVIAEVAGVSTTATTQATQPLTPRPTPRPRVVEARLISPTSTPTPRPAATTAVTLGPLVPTPTPSTGGGANPTTAPKPTNTPRPTATKRPPTSTPVPPTSTPVPPTAVPTAVPTTVPTVVPTAVPTVVPTTVPTVVPTAVPTAVPTIAPTVEPTVVPTDVVPPTAEASGTP